MKNLLSGALVLFSLTLYGGESNFIRVETRMGFGGRIATGKEKIGSVDGTEVHEIDTTVMEDAWTMFSSDGATSSLCVLNDPAVEGGRLDADTTWDAERVHVVRDNVVVSDGMTLTLPCDCIVKFTEGARIYVESGGRIAAKGAILTDVADDTVGGDTNLDGGSSTPSGEEWWNDDAVIGAFYRELLPSGRERVYFQRPITLIVDDGASYGYEGDILLGYVGEMSDGYELVIPDGVTVIGCDAFYKCKELKSVTFPMGVMVIEEGAFGSCGGLISVTLPPSVTEIMGMAFHDSARLGAVKIPSSVTKIGRNAFEGTALLAGYPDGPVVVDDCLIAWKGKCSGPVEIPDGVRLIADEVFDEREELTSVKIPSSVTSIGERAFRDCYGLTSVTIPLGVTNIGDGAFLDCCSLMSVTIHEGVTSIGEKAFCGCSGLTSVTIPKGVTSIGSEAFYDCNSLTSVTIPSSVTSIGSEAFSYCDSLTSINIPSSVTSIGDDAFYDCSGLGSGVVIVDGCVLTVNGKCPSVVELPKGTRLIGGGAFTGCRDLTSVTIPSSVTSIGDDAFGGCSGLTSVTIPEGVMSIGERAFDGCDGLTSITIPRGVTSIGELAFCDCSSLTSIILPSSVTSIEPFTFEGCDSLTSVTIPEGVTSIGDWAFYDCIGLTSVNIPSSVTNISDAFCGCSGLGSGVVIVDGCVLTVNGECPSVVVLPKGTRLIGGGAFYDCSGLTSVTIPEGVTIIGEGAFRRCRNLTSVTIPSSVTGIGRTVFYDCSSLTSVTIPEGVTSIGESAFSYCSGLTSVTIPSSVTSIAYNAFACCNEFKTVYVCSGDVERIKNLLKQSGFSISGVFFVEVGSPAVGMTIEGDEGATVTGDAETGFVIRPSEGKTTVEVLIPQGVDVTKVTVEVSPKVTSVKPNGARVKVVNGNADITEFLNIPAADRFGKIDLASAVVKEEIVKEALDPAKGARIELDATDPKLKTAATREGLFYQLREGETLEGMKDGDYTAGNGQPWSPKISVRGGNSAFYSIDVRTFIILSPIRRLVDF